MPTPMPSDPDKVVSKALKLDGSEVGGAPSSSSSSTSLSANIIGKDPTSTSKINNSTGNTKNNNISHNLSSPSSDSDGCSDDLQQYDQDLENIYDEQFQMNQPLSNDDEDDLGGLVGEPGDLLTNDENEDDFFIGDTCSDGQDDLLFDSIVGQIEDIAVSSEFQDLMLNFCKNHCEIFEDTEENKLEYTDVFNKWTTTIETYIEERLKEVFEDFSTAKFLQQLCERSKIEDEIMEEVLELLVSLSDFETFKQMMLTHKSAKPEHRAESIKGVMHDLSLCGKASKLHG